MGIILVAALVKGMPMALSVELALKADEVLYQQDVPCRVRITNAGTEDASVPPLPSGSSRAAVVTRNVATGERVEHRRPRERYERERIERALGPGETAEEVFSLFNVIDDLAPGEYDVSVAWPAGEGADKGTEEIVSSAARLRVLPATAAAASPMVDIMGGSAKHREFAWVNSAGGLRELVWTSCWFDWGVHVTSRPLGVKVGPGSSPVASSPPCDEAMLDPWIAWIEGGELVFLSVPPTGGGPRVMRLRLEAKDAVLVGPLHIDPQREDAGDDAAGLDEDEDDEDAAVARRVPPDGGALVMYPAEKGFRLQSIVLTPKGARTGKASTFDGPAPAWIHSHARSAKERLVRFVQSEGKRIALRGAAWPGHGGLRARTREFGTWQGRLLSANARMDLDGGLTGAFLIEGAEPGGGPRLVSWAISDRNEFEVECDLEIGWDAGSPVEVLAMEVDDNGVATVLLHDGRGRHHLYTQYDELRPLPEGLVRAGRPVMMGFRMGASRLVVLPAREGLGFRPLGPDGEPFPRHAIAENK